MYHPQMNSFVLEDKIIGHNEEQQQLQSYSTQQVNDACIVSLMHNNVYIIMSYYVIIIINIILSYVCLKT